MSNCIICHFEAVPDDVAIPGLAGGCVCLRCYARETATERRMPRALRRAITAVLPSAVEPGA